MASSGSTSRAERGLTEQQRRFIREYLVDLNARAAARRAGYSAAAAPNAARWLRENPALLAAVRAGQARHHRRLRATADRVLRDHARIAFSDMRNFVTWGRDAVTLVPAERLGAERAALALVSAGPEEPTLIRLHDKRRALDAVARHLGLFR
jgi:phage terminase small subunit